MKSILISINPKWVVKILNGEKTIEIRKTAPKCDLPIDVYIYCTKTIRPISDYDWGTFTFDDLPKLGKVVAKFTLREVTQYINGCNVSKDSGYMFGDAEREGVYEKACLSESEIDRYCPDESFYAWHISDLVIFDKPKNLNEFNNVVLDVEEYRKKAQTKGRQFGKQNSLFVSCLKKKPINRAPQSWCYIETEEKIGNE